MKGLIFYLVMGLCTCAMTSQSQEIVSKLSGGTTGQGFSVLDDVNNLLFTVRGNGNTGIGTTNPAFKLTLDSDGGILATGTMNAGATLPSTSGSVMIWYPRKAAFRVGHSSSGSWNDANIGTQSFATGLSTTASSDYTVAVGNGSIASGPAAFASGWLTTASGWRTTAMGTQTTASGNYSTAIGALSTASGNYAVAVGNVAVASGENAIAIGNIVTASGSNSVAVGKNVSTNGRTGSMFLGDASPTTLRQAYADNHFYAAFDHGYSLFTDRSGGNNYCVYLLNHSTSWSSCSDSTKKERRMPVDGEYVLEKFSRLQLGSWNFIGHDPRTERHYGPMAQEWFSAFGHDGVGTIGSDTLLASADVDGVLCIAIQALENRTSEQRKCIQELQDDLHAKDREITDLRTQLSSQEHETNELRREYERRYSELARLVRNLQQEREKPVQHVQLLGKEAEQ